MSEDKKKRNLMDDMFLDVQELDRAALDQPSMYAYWGQCHAEAVFRRDKLKEKLDMKRADLDKRIRSNPEKYGATKDKVAENWVNAQILNHQEYLDVQQEINDAQYEVAMAQVARDCCEHRLRSISMLVELYKGNYFAASSKGIITSTSAFDNAINHQTEQLNKGTAKAKLTKKK